MPCEARATSHVARSRQFGEDILRVIARGMMENAGHSTYHIIPLQRARGVLTQDSRSAASSASSASK
jgi:hypothetical protein